MPVRDTPDDITSALGLARPFDTYAPRTQRRYRAAYRRGLDRERALAEERVKRSAQPTTRARESARQLRRLHANVGGSHDNDNITRLISAVGAGQAAEILETQLKSIRQFKATGSSVSGRDAWAGRENIEISGDEMIDLTPYFYYKPPD